HRRRGGEPVRGLPPHPRRGRSLGPGTMTDSGGSAPEAGVGPVRSRGILEVPGIGLGHAGQFSQARMTGLSVVLPPPGSTVGVDVRGGGPATRETDVIVFPGGSAFGLGAVSGVVGTLAEAGRGSPAAGLDGTVIPLVPAAAIFDLGRGDGSVSPPTPDEGALAARAALSAASGATAD